MINLLPPQQKKELFWEERCKLFLIFGISAIVFLIALTLALLAVKIYISGQVQSYRIITAAISKDDGGEINKINQRLEDLDSFYGKSPDFSEFLEKISSLLPQKTYLISLSLAFSQKDGDFLASLQGFSPTRELLLQIKKNLESELNFKDINFPASNWVKPENIEFSVNFKVKI